MCIYDDDGVVAGGSILHGAPEWKAIGGGFLYTDAALSRHGIRKLKMKSARGGDPRQGQGAGHRHRRRSRRPFRCAAQLVNLDNGACWESVFPTAKKNEANKVIAVLP